MLQGSYICVLRWKDLSRFLDFVGCLVPLVDGIKTDSS